ncbi:Protein MAIN-LIKE 2 [Glycine max]|nr:Protein MAIN-LIKE 2 [Glycine max]
MALMFDYPRAYLLHLLGCTLFVNKSATHVHVVFLDAPCDLTQSGGYAWGAAALVHMYDNLNDASKSTARQLAALYYRLCWIYEHFSSVGSAVPVEDYDERRPRACRWTSSKALPISTYRRRLDRLTPDVVFWISYGDHCSFREFEMGPFDDHSPTGEGCTIVRLHLDYSATSCNFGEYIAPIRQLCVVPSHYSPDYIDWFYMISHPFMSLAQPGDPLEFR